MTVITAPSRKIALRLCSDHSHGPMRFLEIGRAEAPPLIFIHGFGADLLTWQFCLVRFSQTHRVIAIDLPGHGRSAPDVGEGTLAFMTDWLHEALGCLSVRRAHLVGHSMGAKIAKAYSAAHPDHVLSLSLIAPAGLGGAFRHDLLRGLLAAPGQDSAARLAGALLGSGQSPLHAGLMKSLMDVAHDPARNAALRKLLSQATAYEEAMPGWATIRSRLQIIWGDDDRIIPMPQASCLPPHAMVHIIKGAGHLPHMEASKEVITHLQEFLA